MKRKETGKQSPPQKDMTCIVLPRFIVVACCCCIVVQRISNRVYLLTIVPSSDCSIVRVMVIRHRICDVWHSWTDVVNL